MELPVPRRPVNGLNIEAGEPSPRCFLKPPVNIAGIAASGVRWLGSGGSPLAFGPCIRSSCPLAESCSAKEEKENLATIKNLPQNVE